MPLDEDEAARLYALPLEDFVRERDALARRLRKEGDRDSGDAVARLQKPSVAAWAINRVARARPDDVRALVEAADRVRAAQTTGSEDFAGATAAQRDAIRTVAAAAGEALREAGRPATEATLDKVTRTLTAAVVDESTRSELERGTLTRDLEPAGFGGLLGAVQPSPPRQRAKRAPKPDRARERAEAREAVSELRARARELRREAEAAEREAAQTRRALERAEEEVERARAEADRVAEELAEAERRLRSL